jgi:DNA polymerase-3 subunit gamma/tau
LDTANAIKFLKHVAANESIICEPEALALIAGLADGQPRDLLQRLDQMWTLVSPGRVTLAQTKLLLGVNYTDALMNYVAALAAGDLPVQTQLLLEWNENLATKVKIVQLFVLALYYNDLLGIDVVVDPLIASLSTEERRPIVDRFRARLSAADVDINSFWRDMLAFWSVLPPEQTEATLLLRAALFHRLVNEPRRPAPSFATVELPSERSLAPRSRRENRLHANSAKRPRRTKSQVRPDYLDSKLVGDVINAASMLTQQYGKTFNARLTIWHRAFGIDDARAAAGSFSAFGHAFGEWLQLNSKDQPYRCALQEYDKEKGYCGRFVVHVPNHLELRAANWLRGWRVEGRLAGWRDQAVELDPIRGTTGCWI